MATTRRSPQTGKRTYTPIENVGCYVAVIEIVYQGEDINDVESVLGQLQQYAAAEVISRTAIGENYEAAVTILKSRAAK